MGNNPACPNVDRERLTYAWRAAADLDDEPPFCGARGNWQSNQSHGDDCSDDEGLHVRLTRVNPLRFPTPHVRAGLDDHLAPELFLSSRDKISIPIH